jgi:hypothetical protein
MRKKGFATGITDKYWYMIGVMALGEQSYSTSLGALISLGPPTKQAGNQKANDTDQTNQSTFRYFGIIAI